MSKKIEEEVLEVETTTEENASEKQEDESKFLAFVNAVSKKFLAYTNDIWVGFVDSFRYNPCKLAGILVALPGLFIGFFLKFHSAVRFIVEPGSPDLSGLYMFIMVLLGCINVFNGVTLSSKRNLGTVIVSAVCSLVIVVFGALWIYSIANSFSLVNNGIVDPKNPLVFTADYAISIVCVALAMICSTIGCILGYLKRDKSYKKVKI